MGEIADGAIIIDVKMDTEATLEAIKELKQVVTKFVDNFEKQFGGIDKAVEKSSRNISKMKIAPSEKGIEEAVRALDILNAKIETEQHLLDELCISYGRTVSITSETGAEALQLQRKILKAEDAIAKMTRSSDSMATAIGEAESAMQDGGDAAENLQGKSGKAEEGLRGGGKGAAAFQVALGSLIARGIEKAISALADLSEKTFEYRQDMAMLAQNAKDSGVGLGFANDAVKYLNGTTNDLSGSLEAVNSLMSTGLKENQMVAAIEALSGAVARFPGTYSIDTLAASLQETIKSGKATEQFAELLGRSGQNVGDFNRKMADSRSESQRTNIAMQALAKTGLADTSREYRINNKALVDAADAQYEYNGALATLGSVLEPTKTSLIRDLTGFLTDNQRAITEVAEAVAYLAGMVIEVLSVLATVPPSIIIAIGTLAVLAGTFFKVYEMVNKATGGTGDFKKAFQGIEPGMIRTTAIIMGVVVALIALAAIIAVIAGKKDDLAEAMSSIGNSVGQINSSINSAQSGYYRGYASGTLSASPGLHWVGERGPELMDFKGGEIIHNATNSLAMRAIEGMNPIQQSSVYNITIDAKNVKEFNDIVRIAQKRQQSIRMGYVKG